MRRLQTLKPSLGVLDTRAAKPPQKVVDPHYLTPEHRAWSDAVIKRAGERCEAVDERTGWRCHKARPAHRMFADHIVEKRDGGALYDPANGRCLCGAHHMKKTLAERAERMARGMGV